jgi:hypothetical protein
MLGNPNGYILPEVGVTIYSYGSQSDSSPLSLLFFFESLKSLDYLTRQNPLYEGDLHSDDYNL